MWEVDVALRWDLHFARRRWRMAAAVFRGSRQLGEAMSASKRTRASFASQPESLEVRRLFAVAPVDDNPHPEDKPQPDVPEVTAVYVASTQWTPGFRQYLQAADLGLASFGFQVRESSDPLPWTNINQISVRFSEKVNIEADDLDIIIKPRSSGSADAAASAHADIIAFTLADDGRTATWTISRTISRAAEVDLRIRDKDISAATDDDSNQDDNPSNRAFDFDFDVVPGDVNRNGVVNATDLVMTRNRVGRAVSAQGNSAPFYSPFVDVDGDGVINASDLVLVRNRIGNRR